MDKIIEKINDNFPAKAYLRLDSNDASANTSSLGVFRWGAISSPVICRYCQTDRCAKLLHLIRDLKLEAVNRRAAPLLLMDFIGPRLRGLAQEEQINYADKAGNLFFVGDGIIVEYMVDKNPFSKKLPLKNIFSPVSSRITRVLLSNRGQKWRLATLAQASRVSLGQAHKTVKALMEEEFVRKDAAREITVADAARLLDEWAIYYRGLKIEKQLFFSLVKTPDELLKNIAVTLPKEIYAVSFVTGANLVAPFIRNFNRVQLYLKDEAHLPEVVRKLSLNPVDSGQNLEIYRPYDEAVFSQAIDFPLPKTKKTLSVADPLQLYLDANRDPARGADVADHLRTTMLGY